MLPPPPRPPKRRLPIPVPAPPSARPSPWQKSRAAIAAAVRCRDRGSPALRAVGAAFGGDEAAAIDFFVALLEMQMLVGQQHPAWAAALKEAAKVLRVHGVQIPPMERAAYPGTDFVVLYLPPLGSKDAAMGYFRYDPGQAVAWICCAMLECAAKPLRSLVDLPETLVRCALERGPPISAFVAERMVKVDSSPTWSALNAFLARDPAVRAVIHQERRAEEAFLAGIDAKPEAPAGGGSAAILSSVRVACAAFVYWLFRAREEGIEEVVRRAFPDAPTEDGALPPTAKLFTFAERFLRGEEVDYAHGLLLSLGPRAGDALGLLDAVAEDVRTAILCHACMPCVRTPGSEIVVHLTAAMREVDTVLDTFRTDLSRLMAGVPAGFRAAYRRVREVRPTEFMHELDRAGEYDTIDRLEFWWSLLGDQWWTHCPIQVLRGRSRDPKSQISDRQLLEEHGRFDEEFVVVRFEDGTLPFEVHATMDMYAGRYPEWLGSIPAGNEANNWLSPFYLSGTHEPREGRAAAVRLLGSLAPTDDEDPYTSRAFYVGTDARGSFLFMRRIMLEALRRIMLREALVAHPRFEKPMPVFPLLSRFYFTCLDPRTLATEAARAKGLGKDHRPERVDPVDDVSIDCVVSVMAHWLRVGETRTESTEGGARTAKAGSRPAFDYVPLRGSAHFTAMRKLHRLADQLERACESRNGSRRLDMPALEAVRCYLELMRPRSMRLSAVREMKVRLDAAEGGRLANPDLAELLDVIALSYRDAEAPEDVWVPLDWDDRLEDAYVQLWEGRNDLPRLLLPRQPDPAARAALFNWLW